MSKEKYQLKVVKGGFEPLDNYTRESLNKKFKIGDIVNTPLSKSRCVGHNKHAHKIGKLISNSIEDFKYLDAHQVLKRIQLEANIGCIEMAIAMKGIGAVAHRVPKSLNFDDMDNDEFLDIVKNICRYVSETYWHECTKEQIEEMAKEFIDE